MIFEKRRVLIERSEDPPATSNSMAEGMRLVQRLLASGRVLRREKNFLGIQQMRRLSDHEMSYSSSDGNRPAHSWLVPRQVYRRSPRHRCGTIKGPPGYSCVVRHSYRPRDDGRRACPKEGIASH